MSEFPIRNLPETSVPWGRTVEGRVLSLKGALRRVESFVHGANRSDAAVTQELARQIRRLADSAEDLEDVAKALPVIKHKLAREQNFGLTNQWQDTATTTLTIPEGKSEASLTAVGLAHLYIRDDSGGGGDGGLPSSFTAVSDDSTMTVNMTQTMLEYALAIFNIGQITNGVNRQATVIAFMTVFVESVWLMYANSNVPASLSYPHDAVGSDHDSLGLFQQRPSAGWGSVAELMDVGYNAQAFFGGGAGPNAGNPPGLLDISGWESMGYGAAAQAVQVSAFPERYDNWRTASEGLYDAILNAGGGSHLSLSWPFVPEPSPDGDMPPVGSSDEPLAEYGPRDLTGSFHEGMDFGYRNATAGASIPAAGDGTVHTNSAAFMGYGNAMIIDHGLDGNGDNIYTLYAHRQSVAGPSVGSPVSEGDIIGTVGSSGNVTGPHLHFEVHVVPPGGSLTWDYTNPSYDSPRTAVDPRDYIGGGGGDGGSVRQAEVRLVIDGQASPAFQGKPTGDFEFFHPNFGRTVSATEGAVLPVTLQARASGDTTVKSETESLFTVIGSFT